WERSCCFQVHTAPLAQFGVAPANIEGRQREQEAQLDRFPSGRSPAALLSLPDPGSNSLSGLLPAILFGFALVRDNSMLSMQGKNAVIFGVANKRSIAWAIAQRLSEAGARLAVTYLNERMKAEAYDLITSLPGAEPFQCDVSSDAEIDQLFAQIRERFEHLDVLVHSVAYALSEDLRGDFLNTSREGFRIAHDVSAYSLIAVTRAAVPLMTNGGSVLTMTYFGAEKVVPGYNIMGVAKASLEATVRYLANSLGPKKIRVNAISAGPIKTLA